MEDAKYKQMNMHRRSALQDRKQPEEPRWRGRGGGEMGTDREGTAGSPLMEF